MLRLLVGAAALAIVVLGLKAAADFLAPVLFAVVFAILINPLLERLRRRGMPNGLALLLVCLLVVVLGLALIALLYVSVHRLVAQVPYYQELLALRLEPIIGWLGSRGIDASDIGAAIAGADVTRALLGLLLGIVGALTSSLFVLFIILFLLSDGPGFVNRSHGLMERNPGAAATIDQISRSIRTQSRLAASNNLVSATGVTIGLFFLGIDFALLWGVLSFLLAFIPNVGIIIATIPAVLLAFIQYGPGTAALVALLVIVVNLVMDNLVTPRRAGHGLNLSPALVFLSFIFWTWVFGPIGALLAMPLTVTLKTLAQSLEDTRWLAILASARIDEGGAGSGPGPAAPRDRDRAA